MMRLQDARAELRSSFQSALSTDAAPLLAVCGRFLTAKNKKKKPKTKPNPTVVCYSSKKKTKKRILTKRVHEFGSITIIAHQQTANSSIIVKSLFILIAPFDCFPLLLVGGGPWPPAHSHRRLCWQAALVHRKLPPDFSTKDAESKEKRKSVFLYSQ